LIGCVPLYLPDATPEDLQPFYYKMMGYNEASFQEIVTKGLSAAYVTSETKRAIAGTGGRVKVFPAIDIDVPTAAEEIASRAASHPL
jgi:hypothetical protein